MKARLDIFHLYRLMAIWVAATMCWVSLKSLPPSTDESIIALQARHIVSPPSDKAVRESIQPQPLFGRFPLLFMAQPYLFPLEAYIAAIPQIFLPTGAFGVRAVPFALSFAALFLSFSILRRFGSVSKTWPGLLLLGLPSAYVLMMQFGYALPSYPSHLLWIALAIWLLQRYADRPQPIWAGLCGLTCAAALAGQLMAAPLLLLCGMSVLLIGNGWHRVSHAAFFAAISACGWIPIGLAKRLYPGAYDAVAGLRPWHRALERLWSPALTNVLPVASGIRTTLFPDNRLHIELLPWLTNIWPYIWIALMLLAIAFLAVRLRIGRTQGTGARPVIAVVFVGLSISAVILFAFSRRSHSHTYRYLLTAAWALPFVVAYLYREAPWRWLRWGISAFSVALALYNAVVIGYVLRAWRRPDFAPVAASIFDTGPALAYLEDTGLNRVYAAYGLAYRLTYLSNERIIAAQYYNERFYGWPLPYKAAVDHAGDVAYVLSSRSGITVDRFMKDLEGMRVAARVIPAGDLTIFHDFKPLDGERGDWLSPNGLRASSSHRSTDAYRLVDGAYECRWRSHQAQEPGMWISLEWDELICLEKICLYYNYYPLDRARALDVYVLQNGDWIRVRENVERGLDRREYDRGRPVYGNQFQSIEIPACWTRGVRIAIAKEDAERDWTIGEVRLWGKPIATPNPFLRGDEASDTSFSSHK